MRLIDKKDLPDFLMCPDCAGDLLEKRDLIICSNCKNSFKVINGIPILFSKSHPNSKRLENDLYEWMQLKSQGKQSSDFKMLTGVWPVRCIKRILAFGEERIGPFYRKVFGFIYNIRSFYKSAKDHYEFLEREKPGARSIRDLFADTAISVEIGGGPSSSPCTYSINIRPYENVSLVGDGHKLPIRDNSIHIIENEAVMEHIENPEEFLNELFRILTPGGILRIDVPFLQEEHGGLQSGPGSLHDGDYYRYTPAGMLLLAKKFETLYIGPSSGPFGACAWTLYKSSRAIFSSKSRPLDYLFAVFHGYILPFFFFWWKFFDYLPWVKNSKIIMSCAGGYRFFLRKPASITQGTTQAK